jgi:peptidyl-prolyl cis-trans isomerase SurA
MNGFAMKDRADEDGRLKPPPRRAAQGVWLLLILMAVAGRAEVIDRISITVGSRAITDSDILREVRLAAFFNQAEADFSPVAKRQAAVRLVERALIEMEMEAGQYEFPEASEATPALETMKKDRSANEGAWPGALSKYRLAEADVRRHLLEQLALENFIDERFGPAVQVSDDEMREYYAKRFVPAWEAGKRGAAPPFEEVRGEIGQILRAQRADELLTNWLKESRERIRIEFRDEALR